MARKQSATFTLVAIGTLVLNLSLNIYFVAVLKRGLEGILVASIIARAINMIWLLIIMVPKPACECIGEAPAAC